MWLRACANADVAVESATNAASDSSPRPSAWSISPWTHDSGPTSNSGAVSVDKAEGSVGSININRETHQKRLSKIRARRLCHPERSEGPAFRARRSKAGCSDNKAL